jgi:diguanylate cyclase (GGDEF)-like protein
MARHVVMFCNHYQKEVLAVLSAKAYADVHPVFFPGVCGQPPLAWKTLYESLLEKIECDSVDVICGPCISGMDASLPGYHYFNITGLKQCFHMVANPDLIDQYQKNGCYLVTPGWLKRWDYFIRHWGFDQQTARDFFAEFTTGIHLLDTGVDPDAIRNLQAFSAFLNRPCQVTTVGLGLLDLLLNNIVLKRQLAVQRRDQGRLLENKQRETSQYAMSLDLLKTLTTAREENQVVEKIVEIFEMLFAPGILACRMIEEPALERQPALSGNPNRFILPISLSGRILGQLEIGEFQFPEYTTQYLNLASNILSVSGLAVENARHYQTMKNLSNTDGLTQIANRRRFDEHLNSEWRRMSREEKPVGIIILDVDLFKRFNDYYGHQAGDDCLRSVAAVLQKICRRPGDLAARYGGEEFVVILSGADDDGAMQRAGMIRDAVEKLHIPHEDSDVSRYVTASLGVATRIPTSRFPANDLVLAADKALYQAKMTGRNRVVAAKDVSVLP